MSEFQYKPRYTNRYDLDIGGLYAVGSAESLWRDFDAAFKKWEVRRGFVTEEQQKLGLRGRAFSYGQFKNRQKSQEENPAPKVVKKTAKKVVKKKAAPKKVVKKKK